MATAVHHDAKESTVVVHFGRDWKHFHAKGASTVDDPFSSSTYDDRQWTTIRLPHHDIKSDSSVHWYRQHFEWKRQADAQQHVYLSFTPDEIDKSKFHGEDNVSITAWLNEHRIYEGLVPETIELTRCLKSDSTNVLAIRCNDGRSLSFRASVTIPQVQVGQVNYDDVDQTTSKKRRHKLDYSVSFNDSDGLIDVFIDSFSKLNAAELMGTVEADEDNECEHVIGTQQTNIASTFTSGPIPRLAIVMLIVGTRGDVQPFIALAKALLACGHRVRLATHDTFRKFVRDNGIEFYPLAGDPADLMSFVVKNAGILPSIDSIMAGDVAKNRRTIGEILESTWKACVEDDDELGVPFVAEAIIANPPSYGHVHCAQKLQIPLHMMFTMPWSPTASFPHPFCKVDYNRGPVDRINTLSYDVIEMLTWTGMRDLINDFRKATLGLPALHTRQAVRLLIDERVPYTYCWSPSVVPRPADWPGHIDVCGFFFLDLATNYEPPADLVQFLKSGDPPIYIGFGSITGHNPARVLKVILQALAATGYRALLSGLAAETDQLPSNVFRMGNCPHDWLFQHVAAVCHHGGAGTTAAGLRAGKPTIVVPFFGDQFFWGSMINKSGAGPSPIPGKRLNVDELVEAFKMVHEPGVRAAAEKLRAAFEHENGCDAAVHSFHARLPLDRMQSALEPSFSACYRLKEYDLQISRPVAQVLFSAGAIEESDLSINPTRDWCGSMYDSRPHVPIHGFMKHGRKAFTNLFIDTAQGLRQAASAHSLAAGTLTGAESIAKGVGKSLGHVSVGCLSLYGEITDVLEHLPAVYDPYHDADKRRRPHVDDLSSGAKAAEHSLIHGIKDGVTGLVNTPRAGYHRHGVLGGAAGAAIAIPNMVIKPVAGTLASITWLGRGLYAEAKQRTRRKDSSSSDQTNRLSPYGHRRASSGSSLVSDDTSPVGQASAESGLTVEVCKQILDEFYRITNEQRSRASSTTVDDAPSKKKKESNKMKKIFQRQRSHSATPH